MPFLILYAKEPLKVNSNLLNQEKALTMSSGKLLYLSDFRMIFTQTAREI